MKTLPKTTKLSVNWEEVKRMFLYGNMDIKKLAAHFKCNKNTISMQLRARGVNTFHRLDNFDMTAATKAYQGGMSIIAIAKQMGCSPHKLRTALIRKGVKLRPRLEAMTLASRTRVTMPFEKQLQAKKLFEQKMSVKKIAEIVDASPCSIARNLRLMGCDVPDRGLFHQRRWNEFYAEKEKSVKWDVIAKRYNAGESMKKLRLELGLSMRWISNRLKERGVHIRKCKDAIRVTVMRARPDANWDLLSAMKEFRQGATIEALAKKYKQTRRVIAKALQDNGLKVSAIKDIPDHIKPKIIAEYDAGITMEIIRARYGYGHNRLARFLKATGRKPTYRTQDVPVEKQAEVAAQYRKGASINELSVQYSLGYNRVRRFLLFKGLIAERNQVPEALRPNVIADFDAQTSITDLVRKYSLSRKLITRFLISTGRNVGKPLNPDIMAELLSRYDAGETVVGLADALHIGAERISGILLANGRTLRGTSRKISPEQEALILKQYESGRTVREIGAELGIGTTWLSTFLRMNGKQILSHPIRDISDDVKQAVVSAVREGMTITAAHFKFKVPLAVIHVLLTQEKVPYEKKSKEKDLPEELKPTVLAEYDAGGTIMALSEKYHLGVPRIRRFLVSQGRTISQKNRMRGVLPVEMQQRIADQYRSGASGLEISRSTGVRLRNILDTLKQLGIPLRPRGFVKKTLTSPNSECTVDPSLLEGNDHERNSCQPDLHRVGDEAGTVGAGNDPSRRGGREDNIGKWASAS